MYHCTHTLLQLLPKRSYLCLSNYSEPYYDFNCLTSPSELPVNGSHYYTICGNPFPNLMEYRLVIVSSCLIGLAFFYQVMFNSSRSDKLKKQWKDRGTLTIINFVKILIRPTIIMKLYTYMYDYDSVRKLCTSINISGSTIQYYCFSCPPEFF